VGHRAGWNIIPAGVGNMIGAALLVAIPYWFVFQRDRRSGRGTLRP
jgi:formate/nitrite transporter FocA (FNT family)